MRNFSESCERNKSAILAQLIDIFGTTDHVLEVGSYSGQHILHFAKTLHSVTWQPSDITEHLLGLQQNFSAISQQNCKLPIELNVEKLSTWPHVEYSGVYSANTLHIMSWEAVKMFFNCVSSVLKNNGLLVVYGPFKYNDSFTSESNERFELWLKERNSDSGIRDFEKVNRLAIAKGLVLKTDISMPANNQLLVWQMVD